MKKKLIILLKTGIGMLTLLILLFFAFFNKKEYKGDMVNDNWNYITSIQMKNSGSIPTYYDNEKNNVYILSASHNITDEMRGKTLAFETNDAFVDVYISESINAAYDNTNVFSKDNRYNESERVYHYGKKMFFADSPGSKMHFIQIPADAAGAVTIRFETAYRNNFTKNYNFMLGSEDEISKKLLSKELLLIIAGVIQFLLGVIMIALFICKGKKETNRDLILIGLFAAAFPVHFICKSFFGQLLIRSFAVRYYLYFVTFFMLPFLFIKYVDRLFERLELDVRLKVEFTVIAVITGVIGLLHFIRAASFTKTISAYYAWLLMLIIIALIHISRKLKIIRADAEAYEEADGTDEFGYEEEKTDETDNG